MNLLFSADKNYYSLLLDCLWSVAERGCADVYDAYILCSDFNREDKNLIEQNVQDSIHCHFVSVPQGLFDGFPVSKRYPLQIYYRLAAPMFLPADMDRILYLDADITVINSLIPLYQSSFDGNWFMACTHTAKLLTKANRVRLGIDVDEDVPYINTGVMMMDMIQLREHLRIEDIRQYVERKQRSLILPDQDILTALYGGKVKLLDSLRYNLSDRTLAIYNADPSHQKIDLTWVRENGVIIHYFGRNKPWNPHYIGILDVFYHECSASRRRKEQNVYETESTGTVSPHSA